MKPINQRGGWVLIAAIAIAFALLMMLAAWNRWRAVPTLTTERSATAANALRRVIGIEYLLLVAVLATTAVLTSFYSP